MEATEVEVTQRENFVLIGVSQRYAGIHYQYAIVLSPSAGVEWGLKEL